MKMNIKAILIGIKAGIISSSCCIIPLILVLFGLVSIGSALSFVKYKPYFILLGTIFLIGSLILYIRKDKACCTTNKKFLIGTAVVTHILIFILLLYVIVPIVAPVVYTGDSTNEALITSTSHKLMLKINGMTCSSCAYGVQYQLQQLDGVIDADISFLDKTAEVIYNPDQISKEEIINSGVFERPYSAEIIKDESMEG